MVMRQAGLQLGLGLALGLGLTALLALLFRQVLVSLLFDTSPLDPLRLRGRRRAAEPGRDRRRPRARRPRRPRPPERRPARRVTFPPLPGSYSFSFFDLFPPHE